LIHIFYGADDFSSREALNELKMSLGDQETLLAGSLRLEGAKLRADEFESAVQSVPFFGEKRLIIVDGLLGRFETREKRGGVKKSAKVLKEGAQDLQKQFAGIINSTPESSVLVLIDGDLKSTLGLKEISPEARIHIFSPLKGIQLENWAKKRITQAGAKITDEALKNLVRLVGGDLWIMKGEIEKLVLYAGESVIDVEDVKKLVGLSRESSIFTLVDSIIDGKLNLANQCTVELLETGAAPSYVLAMLARQLRLLVRARALMSNGQSENSIQGALGLADYPFRKTIEQASRYSMPRLKVFYHHLLDADLSIKTGKYDDELALTILVSDLCTQTR
jgi:DNA polymerase-3 subunit delta